MEINASLQSNLETLPEISQVLLSEKQIQNRVRELGEEISSDYSEKEPITIAVLKGAAIFHADLIRSLSIGVVVDFISVSSYQASTKSSGAVKILKDAELNLEGKDILLVEDIIDTGLTINQLIDELKKQQPASIRICSLLSKPERRKIEVPIDYLGFEIPDIFVVGFGLDYAEKYRNLPFIGVLNQTEI